MSLGTRVKKAREDRNLTQQALANIVGVSGQTISRLERDETGSPLPGNLKSVAAALGVSVEHLLDGTGDEQAPGAAA